MAKLIKKDQQTTLVILLLMGAAALFFLGNPLSTVSTVPADDAGYCTPFVQGTLTGDSWCINATTISYCNSAGTAYVTATCPNLCNFSMRAAFCNTIAPKCSDGTLAKPTLTADACSVNKPQACLYSDSSGAYLANACSVCGCASGLTCRTDGSCGDSPLPSPTPTATPGVTPTATPPPGVTPTPTPGGEWSLDDFDINKVDPIYIIGGALALVAGMYFVFGAGKLRW